MKNWAVAILLGVIVVSLIFAGWILTAHLSVLFTPLLILFIVVLVIWLLLQDAKANRKNGRGP